MNAPLHPHPEIAPAEKPVTVLCASDDSVVRTAIREASGQVMRTRAILGGRRIEPGDVAKADVVFAEVTAELLDKPETVEHLQQIAAQVPVILLMDMVDGVDGARLALRTHAADLLQKPVSPEAVRDAIKDALARQGRPPADVTAVVGAVGGAGTTSLAITLADQISGGLAKPADTVLMDLDPVTAGVGLQLEAIARHDISNDPEEVQRIDSAYLQSMTRSVRDFTVLSPPPVDLNDRTHWPFCLRALDVLERDFANLVLDVPHFIPTDQLQVLAASNRIFVVTLPTLPAMKLAGKRVQALIAQDCPADSIRVVVNRFTTSILSNRLKKADLERIMAPTPVSFLRLDDDALDEAANTGVTVAAARKGSGFVRDVRKAFGEAGGGKPRRATSRAVN